jgi:sugar lactone lactonase YvrE
MQTLTDHRCLLGEGPVWDARRSSLFWVDILRGEIHEYRPADGYSHTISVGEYVGAVAPYRDGRLMAALKSGIVLLDPDTGEREAVGHPEAHLPGNRYNDGKCDPAGRFWVGSMSLQEEPGAGSLYMIDHDRSITRQLEGVTISNGLAWSNDHRTMYYIDTPTFEVAAFDYDIATGGISNRRVAIRIPETDGYPDGMTTDREGCLWIAHWDGWQVTRWDPHTGRKIHHIPMPAARVTSCAFGGDTGNDLYITSARTGLSEEELGRMRGAGGVWVVNYDSLFVRTIS